MASVALVAVVTFFVTRGYFVGTNAHAFWELATTQDVVIVMVLVVIVGIWEEFFFIAVIFATLKKFVPVLIANIFQAVSFVTFLYLIGFRSWLVPFLIMYALYQGIIYHKTNNLIINITIHVCVELIMFGWLLYSARPDLFA